MSVGEAAAILQTSEAGHDAARGIEPTKHISGAWRAWLQPRWPYPLQIEVIGASANEVTVKLAQELVRKCFN